MILVGSYSLEEILAGKHEKDFQRISEMTGLKRAETVPYYKRGMVAGYFLWACE